MAAKTAPTAALRIPATASPSRLSLSHVAGLSPSGLVRRPAVGCAAAARRGVSATAGGLLLAGGAAGRATRLVRVCAAGDGAMAPATTADDAKADAPRATIDATDGDDGNSRLRVEVASSASVAIAAGDGSAAAVLDPVTGEPPSCLFVGPLERATREQLEAFYAQARDSYYSGQPLVTDDMFDSVERRLRWLHSAIVRKYPRCSLRQLYAYSDAESDDTQMATLSGVWTAFLVAGVGLCCAPLAFFAFVLQADGVARVVDPLLASPLLEVDGAMASLIAFMLGVILATSAARPLLRIRDGKLVALHGSCPHCGDDVYSFVTVEGGARHRHKTECHMCGQPLVFHAFVEPSPVNPKLTWIHGKVFAVARAADLAPRA